MHELRDELAYAKAMTATLQQELCALRPGRPKAGVRESTKPDDAEPLPPPKHGTVKPAGPEPALTMPASAIKEIVLGRGTGGYSEGRGPGDDSLQVVVEPRDLDGHSLKVPGCLRVTVLEILPEGLKKPLSTWELSAGELRRTWKTGLFSTGYYVVLPWKCPPSTEKLRVVVRFETAEGRLYESDKDVTIRLLPASTHKSADESPTRTSQKPIRPIASWDTAAPLNEAVRLLRPE